MSEQPTNPIIAAIGRSRSPRDDQSPGSFALIRCDTFSPQIRSVVHRFFDAGTREEIGTIVLCALANDDERIEAIVRDARIAANRIFHRNREPELLRQTLVMISEGYGVEPHDGESPGSGLKVELDKLSDAADGSGKVRGSLDIERLKREVEKRFHRGKRLPRYRWSRVHEALGWPKPATGAAAERYKPKPGRRRRRRSF
jgi:hypothetical protein